MRIFIPCTIHQILSGWSNQRGDGWVV